jgi:uncharacterized protein (DUF433 family)
MRLNDHWHGTIALWTLAMGRCPKELILSKLDYRNIERDAARCGGQPVVSGTRVRVAIILGCYRQGMRVEEIVQQYPMLSLPTCTTRSPMLTSTWTKSKPIWPRMKKARSRPSKRLRNRPHERRNVLHG